MMMSTNGEAAIIVMLCRLSSESASPVVSMITAMAQVRTPHRTVTIGDATRRPRWDMLPITVEAESAEVMKKVASSSIAMMDTPAPNGYSCRSEEHTSELQ